MMTFANVRSPLGRRAIAMGAIVLAWIVLGGSPVPSAAAGPDDAEGSPVPPPAEHDHGGKSKPMAAPSDPPAAEKTDMGGAKMDNLPPAGAEHAGHAADAAATTVPGRTAVELDQAQIQFINFRTTPAVMGPAVVTIRAVGIVAYDETKISNVNTRIMGWAEKLYVDKPGQFVRQGDPLMDIYSPELYSAQSEYLLSYRHCERLGHLSAESTATTRTDAWRESMTDSETLLASSRKRLKLWEISDEEISALEKSGEPADTIQLNSPATGSIIQKGIDPAQMVRPGMTLFRIADLSTIWINANIYEYELPLVSVGQKAVVTSLAQPGRSYDATVDFIFPYSESKTRTTLVRLVMDNQDGLFKPDNYANVEIEVDQGERLLVPDTAVFDTGTQQYVFIEGAAGHFVPRPVQLGPKVGRQFTINEGLAEGEIVVMDGTFLLDSESQLRASAGGGGHQH